jgi:Domain of unknown function (DUF4157)
MRQHKMASRFGHGEGGPDADRPVGKATLTEALGAGDSLPDQPRAQFEATLGRDLAHVRVHTDDNAARYASRLGARAFAVGGDIAFAKGEYDPHSREGRHLLAHEVAHTAQQRGAAPEGEPAAAQQRGAAPEGEPAAAQQGDVGLATTQPGDAAEANADTAATAMMAGQPAEVSAQPIAIARKTQSEPRAPAEPASGSGGSGGAPAGSSAAGTPGAGAGDAEDEIGELTAERIGQEPNEETVAPVVPPHDLEGGKRELAGQGQQLSQDGGVEAGGTGAAGALGDEAPGAERGPGAATSGAGAGGGPAEAGGGEGGLADGGGGGAGGAAGAGGAGGEILASIGEAQRDAREAAAAAESESTAYKAEMAARRDRFDAEQQALTHEQLKTMSATDKRATLADLGYDPKKVAKLKDGELDGLITGKLEAEQHKAKILGMSPEELAALSPAQKLKFLVDLGIDREDLDKAGQAKTDKLFGDITRAAHIPGDHKVKIEIKGGLFGKSWVVNVKCDAEGGVDVQAQKEGGFLSKLVGWIKAALPIILTVIAPLTGGASLIALSVYQTVMAIKSGDWLGAITGAVSAMAGLGAVRAIAQGTGGLAQGLSKIAGIAEKLKGVATAAQTAMIAAKAKNAGSLLAALSAGAAAFAGFAGSQADKFARTMRSWSQRLEKWSQVVAGGEKVLKAIETGDAAAAIGGALQTAGGMAGAGSKTGKALQRASNITGFVDAGRRALQGNPPNYAAVADAALGIAGQLSEDRKVADAARLVSSANRLKAAWEARASNPAGFAEAALALAEAIQLAKYDLEHDEKDGEAKDGEGNVAPEAEREAIVARYQRSTRVVKSAGSLLQAATARPPNYAAALDAATQLIADFTEDKRLDAAAAVSGKLDAWTRAINSGDQRAIVAASLALFQSVEGLRSSIDEERTKSKLEAESRLPPGQPMPEDSGALPHVPPPQAPEPGESGALGDPPLASGIGGGAGSSSSQTPGQAGQTPGQTGQTPGQAPANQPTTPPGAGEAPKPRELPEDARTTLAIIKVFAELAAGFEHPTAKQLIAEWEGIRKQAEALDAKDASTYDQVLAKLRLLKGNAKFIEVVVKEFSSWETKLSPLDEKDMRHNLQALGRFTRNVERLARVAAIPEAFNEAVDNYVIVRGYDKSLSGEPATVTERLVAAGNLIKQAVSIHGELAWLVRVAQAVTAKLGASSAAAAIGSVRTAANKLGPETAKVVMRWVAPILEKIAATSGGKLASDVAARMVPVLAEHGAAMARLAAKPAFRVAVNSLAARLGAAFVLGISWPVTIAIEIGKLEAQFADQLFAETYANVSRWLSSRLFGKTIDELKQEIRGKPDTSFAGCDALVRYAFHALLGTAATRVSRGWVPYLVQQLSSQLSTLLPPTFRSQPEQALLTLDPPDLKLIAAGSIKDIACAYLDQEYRREFGEDP